MTPDQDWRDYWQHRQEANVASEVQRRYMSLTTTFHNLVFHEVGEAKRLLEWYSSFWPNMPAPPLTKLYDASGYGWMPHLLVARSVLALWALLATAQIMVGSSFDPTTPQAPNFGDPMEDSFKNLPRMYADELVANPEAPRMRRPGSDA